MFFYNKRYDITGRQGGIASKITLPEDFDVTKDKCPMVIMMHGFISRKEMQPLRRLASELVEEGVGVIRFDFNAHGGSEGRFIDMTVDSEISDARAVYDYVCGLEYVTNIAFLGHSQGGVIAGMLAGQMENEERKPVCLVQLAPAAVLKDDAVAGQCMGKKYDPVNPPEYVNVFFHKLGRRFIREAQVLPIYEISSRYSGKVCVIHGTQDTIVPTAYSEKYRDCYSDCELHIIDGENHFFSKKKKEVVSIVTSFLKKYLL